MARYLSKYLVRRDSCAHLAKRHAVRRAIHLPSAKVDAVATRPATANCHGSPSASQRPVQVASQHGSAANFNVALETAPPIDSIRNPRRVLIAALRDFISVSVHQPARRSQRLSYHLLLHHSRQHDGAQAQGVYVQRGNRRYLTNPLAPRVLCRAIRSKGHLLRRLAHIRAPKCHRAG